MRRWVGAPGKSRSTRLMPGTSRQHFDAETGLHHNGQRDYDPTLGRFVQPDPAGLEGGVDGYGDAMSRPTSFTDPTGELVPVAAAYAVAPCARPRPPRPCGASRRPSHAAHPAWPASSAGCGRHARSWPARRRGSGWSRGGRRMRWHWPPPALATAHRTTSARSRQRRTSRCVG